MKPLKCLLALLALVLLLPGCDLRNRQSSERFIPTGPAESAPETEGRAAEPTKAPPANPGGEKVKTVWSARGTYERTNPAISYSYEIPFIDLPGGQAAGCNLEIDNRFGVPAREAVKAMERFEAPDVKSISYHTYVRGDVLTLWVVRVDVDGASSHGVYSVLAETGAAPAPADFCRAAGISTEELLPRVREAAEQAVRERCGESWDEDDVACRTAMTKTLAQFADPADLRLYLAERGGLVALAPVYDRAGTAAVEELPVP